jgi:hypothetical protein
MVYDASVLKQVEYLPWGHQFAAVGFDCFRTRQINLTQKFGLIHTECQISEAKFRANITECKIRT